MNEKQPNETPTSRTDAELKWLSRHPDLLKGMPVVSEYFARTIESELAEAKELLRLKTAESESWESTAKLISKMPCGHPNDCGYDKNADGRWANIGCVWCERDKLQSELSTLKQPISDEDVRKAVEDAARAVKSILYHKYVRMIDERIGSLELETIQTLLSLVPKYELAKSALEKRTEQDEALVALAQAAVKTLHEYSYLADGDKCTLHDLRNATEVYLNTLKARETLEKLNNK